MDFGNKGQDSAIVTGGGTGSRQRDRAHPFTREGATSGSSNGRDKARIETAAAAIGTNAHGVVANLMTAEGAGDPGRPRRPVGAGFLLPWSTMSASSTSTTSSKFSDERWHEYFEHQSDDGNPHHPARHEKDMLARDEGSICFISSEAAIRSIANMVPFPGYKNCHCSGLDDRLGRTERAQ